MVSANEKEKYKKLSFIIASYLIGSLFYSLTLVLVFEVIDTIFYGCSYFKLCLDSVGV